MILKGPQLRGLVPFIQQLVTSTRALLTWADDPSVPWRCSLFACSLLMGCPGWDLPSGKAVYPADPLVCYFALPLVTSSNLDEAPPPPLMPTTKTARQAQHLLRPSTFWRQYITHLSILLHPTDEITKKAASFHWGTTGFGTNTTGYTANLATGSPGADYWLEHWLHLTTLPGDFGPNMALNGYPEAFEPNGFLWHYPT